MGAAFIRESSKESPGYRLLRTEPLLYQPVTASLVVSLLDHGVGDGTRGSVYLKQVIFC